MDKTKGKALERLQLLREECKSCDYYKSQKCGGKTYVDSRVPCVIRKGIPLKQ